MNPLPDPTLQWRTVLRVCSGNFLEMYDLMVIGYYATPIAHTFFPTRSTFASLMLTLMTFGAGYLIRPLGAIVLGAYIDRIGRRKGLLLTLGLMSIGTLSIACTPGYAQIGVLAPLLVLLGRLLQGFSAGVELGGVSVYLSEIATPGHKGFYVSWQSASQQVAVIAAALFGVALLSLLPPAAMNAWGWRIPLFIGCLLIPFLFVIRRSLQETPQFQARTHHPTTHEILRSMSHNWRIILVGMMLVMMTTVSFYLITTYTPTFGKNTLHLSERGTMLVTGCVGLSNFLWLPIMGAVSDRMGRRPLLIAGTVLTLLTAYPALHWLVGSPTIARLLIVELWLSFLFSGYNGAMVVYLTELIPSDVRASGFALAYSLATTFGGFTPAICTSLIHTTHNRAAPGIWLSFAATCGLIAALTSRLYAPAPQEIQQLAANTRK